MQGHAPDKMRSTSVSPYHPSLWQMDFALQSVTLESVWLVVSIVLVPPVPLLPVLLLVVAEVVTFLGIG